MKRTNLRICFLSFSQTADITKFVYNGLSYVQKKTAIIEKYGQPTKTFEPNYECGYLSSKEQNMDFYSLEYSNVKFTGNDSDGYIIEYLNFEKDKSAVLTYDNHELTYHTTIDELSNIFGNEINTLMGGMKNGAIAVNLKNGSDQVVLEVRNNKLISITYWSPC